MLNFADCLSLHTFEHLLQHGTVAFGSVQWESCSIISPKSQHIPSYPARLLSIHVSDPQPWMTLWLLNLLWDCWFSVRSLQVHLSLTSGGVNPESFLPAFALPVRYGQLKVEMERFIAKRSGWRTASQQKPWTQTLLFCYFLNTTSCIYESDDMTQCGTSRNWRQCPLWFPPAPLPTCESCRRTQVPLLPSLHSP